MLDCTCEKVAVLWKLHFLTLPSCGDNTESRSKHPVHKQIKSLDLVVWVVLEAGSGATGGLIPFSALPSHLHIGHLLFSLSIVHLA